MPPRPGEPNRWLAERELTRKTIIESDRVIAGIADRMRSETPWPVVMVPADERVQRDPQIVTTISVEWIAAAIAYSRSEGYDSGMEAWRPLVAWANATPDWRKAFDDVVTDPELRAILNTALEAV